MKKLLNQQGIAALEVALLIVVLAVLGFVGYRAYTTRYTAPKPADVKVEKKTTEKMGEVFKIPELGVKGTLPEGMTASDVFYTYKIGYKAGSDDYTYNTESGQKIHMIGQVSLSTHSLVKAQPGCEELFSIEKYDGDTSKAEIASGPGETKKIGNFYYGSVHRQAACSTKPSIENMDTKLETETYHHFEMYLETLEQL